MGSADEMERMGIAREDVSILESATSLTLLFTKCAGTKPKAA